MKHPFYAYSSWTFIALAFAITLSSCSSRRMAIGEDSCRVRNWQPDYFFTQDILPGMESNLRKQRMYIVVGDLEKAGENATGNWLLAVDSVLLPLRLRSEENGAWQWSGSRNFYQSVREGVMTNDEMYPDASGLNLSDAAYLIHRNNNLCTARPLPAVRHIGTVAMP